MPGICGSSTYPHHAQGSWWDEVVGFFLVFCFSGGELFNLTLVFIAYELFDELTNFEIFIEIHKENLKSLTKSGRWTWLYMSGLRPQATKW